jgi:hypothetical protein
MKLVSREYKVMLDHEPFVDRRAALKALGEALDALHGPRYETHIARSRDLIRRDSSMLNPLLDASEGDRAIANPKLTGEHRAKVAGATVIAYGWVTSGGRSSWPSRCTMGRLRAS